MDVKISTNVGSKIINDYTLDGIGDQLKSNGTTFGSIGINTPGN